MIWLTTKDSVYAKRKSVSKNKGEEGRKNEFNGDISTGGGRRKTRACTARCGAGAGRKCGGVQDIGAFSGKPDTAICRRSKDEK